MVYLPDGHAFRSMADTLGYVDESRMVMANSLGRSLDREEIVHHIDRNHLNNHLENLRLFPSMSEHSRHHREMEKLENRQLARNIFGQFTKERTSCAL